MHLVILVVRNIKGDERKKINKTKRHKKKQLKSNHLPEYSFPKQQRVDGG